MHAVQEVLLLFEIANCPTQQYRTNLRTIVPNVDYFKPIVLKFKTLVYNSISKIIYNFCVCRGNILSVVGSSPPAKKFFNIGIFRKKALKYVKTMFESYVCIVS